MPIKVFRISFLSACDLTNLTERYIIHPEIPKSKIFVMLKLIIPNIGINIAKRTFAISHVNVILLSWVRLKMFVNTGNPPFS